MPRRAWQLRQRMQRPASYLRVHQRPLPQPRAAPAEGDLVGDLVTRGGATVRAPSAKESRLEAAHGSNRRNRSAGPTLSAGECWATRSAFIGQWAVVH